MTPAWRRTAALTAALTLLLTITACGNDDAVPSGPEVTFATLPSPDPTTTAAIETNTTANGQSTATTEIATTSPTPSAATTATVPEPLGDPAVALVSIGTFAEPVDLAWRVGDPTSFVVERGGTIVAVRDGATGAPVLDIRDLTDGQGEQGLLGLTFSLDGTTAYIDHTDNSGDTVIAEYAVTADGTFDEASRRVLLTIDQPYGNHNGGDVSIGPDGMLYIGMGDGGSGGDPERRALNVSELLGKILRVDPTPSEALPYTVPADNPFVGIDGAQPEIWAVGLRNPWRFSFDGATGDLWIGDVGQNEIEEVNVAWAADGGGRGLNFGWSAFEGTQRFNEDQSAAGVTPPVHEYEHGDAGCSISGGAVYRGTTIPALAGWYVFGDYCSGRIVGLRMEDRTLAQVLDLAVQSENAAVRVGPDGELYAISLDGDISVLAPA